MVHKWCCQAPDWYVNMHIRTLAFAIIALCAGVVSLSTARAQLVEGVAAVVNDEVITTYDVEQRMRLLLASTNVRPTEDLLAQVQTQAVRSLIDEQVQLQAAAGFEIVISDAEVAQQLERIARMNNVSADAIARDLASRGVDLLTLEQQMRAEIAWDYLVNGRYRSQVRVSDNQIDLALERMAVNADKPSYRIAEILIEPRNQNEAQQAVQFISQQLSQGAPFQALAQQISSAPSAVDGGEVGWVRSGELRHEEIERTLSRMRAGEVQAVETRDGIYFILLLDKRSGVELQRLDLHQVLIPFGTERGPEVIDKYTTQLTRGLRRVRDCDDIDRAAEKIDGAIAQDLGLLAPSEIPNAVRAEVTALQAGERTAPLTLATGVAVWTLCGRQDIAADAMPSREDIENTLVDQQMALYSRRYLRSLLDQATIETRNQ